MAAAQAVEARLTYGGKPLDVLEALIARRQKELNQSAVKAVAATMVTALKSIRKNTLVAKANGDRKGIKAVATGFFLSYRGKNKRPCAVASNARNAPRVALDGRLVLNHGKARTADARIYRVTQEKQSLKPLYVAALNESDAVRYAVEEAERRIRRYGHLAQNALGVAMHKLAVSSGMGGSGTSKRKASEVATLTRRGGLLSTNVYMRVDDNLRYASDAMTIAVDSALKSAANSVSGYLDSVAGTPLDKKIPPFPKEVKVKA